MDADANLVSAEREQAVDMPSDSDAKDDEAMIRFAGEWIPATDAWKKMETATVVVEQIDRFNENFPDLASRSTREVVPLVRQRLKNIEVRMPVKAELPDLGDVARELLETQPPEDVIDLLAERHGMQIDMLGLIQMVGETAYLAALIREGREFQMNRISDDQTAQLWNELRRPAPGGGLWTAQKVDALLQAG
jgi:hypothetical protein